MVEHVAGGQGRHSSGAGLGTQALQPGGIVGTAAQAQREIGAIAEQRAMARKRTVQCIIRVVRQQRRDEPLGVGRQIVPADVEAALLGATLAERQQPRQPPVGRAIGRIDQQRQPVTQVEPAADDKPDAQLRRPRMRPGDPGQGVVVGDGDRRDGERMGSDEQLLDMAGAAQEGVVRGDL